MKTTTTTTLLLMLFILTLPIGVVEAQNWETSRAENPSTTYVHEIDINNSDVDINYKNISITSQIGDKNTIEIKQYNSSTVSQYSKIMQYGDLNQFYLIQEGFENRISAEQNGNSNSIDLNIKGYGSDFEYTQNGSSNYVAHTTLMNYGSGAIKQNGNDNKITLDESGGNYLNGITVKQTGGMTVNITTAVKVN